MKIKFITDGGYDTPGIVGKIVEAQRCGSGYDVALKDLVPLDYDWQEEMDAGTSLNYLYYFRACEAEVVEE